MTKRMADEHPYENWNPNRPRHIPAQVYQPYEGNDYVPTITPSTNTGIVPPWLATLRPPGHEHTPPPKTIKLPTQEHTNR